MRTQMKAPSSWLCLVAILLSQAAPVWGEIKEITGSATATVIQYNGVVEVQRDFSQEQVPQTSSSPPVTARARLDHLLQGGDTTAAGQVITLFDAPNSSGFGTPNDAGLDIAAFSADDATGWFAQGSVSERRTIVLRQGEINNGLGSGNRGRVKSRVVLSGLLLILSSNAEQDLSDVEVRFRFQVLRSVGDEEQVEVLGGSLALVGGPGGTVELQRGAGALANTFLPVFDASSVVPEVPLVRVVALTGLDIPYEYEAVAGQAFDLELLVDAQVQTIPGGTGAAAVFGLPQEGLPSIFERVKQSDAGWRLATAMGELVDTTGKAYVNGDGASASPVSGLTPVCGLVGMEAAAAPLAAGGGLLLIRGRRRRRLGE